LGGIKMFAIKNVESGKYAKHTGYPREYEIDPYPWDLVEDINNAQEYETLEHANEIAFWHLSHYEKWVVVDKDTGQEYEKTMGKYLPVRR
jgi:hypothetical protein